LMGEGGPDASPRRDEPDSGKPALRVAGIGSISGFDRKMRIIRTERLDGSSQKQATGMRRRSGAEALGAQESLLDISGSRRL